MLRWPRMVRPKRLVVVRAGETELFDRLRRRFGSDQETLIFYDRRSRRVAPEKSSADRRRVERRLPQDPRILAARGFFVTRSRSLASRSGRRLQG